MSKVVIDESVINGESEPMLMYENVDKRRQRQKLTICGHPALGYKLHSSFSR